MAEKHSGAAKDAIVEALVLAFVNADIKDVSASGLRSALQLQWDDIFDGEAVDLKEVLDLVPGSAELEPEQSDPPLCRIKVWEEDLGIEVRLPERLAELSTIDRDMLAADCAVPNEELQRVLRKEERRQARVKTKKVRAAAPKRASEKSSEGGSRRVLVLLLAAVVAGGGFGAGGFFLWRELDQRVDATPLPASLGDIPATDLARRGAEAGAVLTDPDWLDEPEDTRRRHMKKALRALRGDGIQVFFLRDDAGDIRATAQFYENKEGRRIVVTFR